MDLRLISEEQEMVKAIEVLESTKAYGTLPPNALQILQTADNLLIEKDGDVVGWVGFAPRGEDVTLDIAVRPEYHGIWAVRGLLKALGQYAFTYMKAQHIIAECFTPKSVKRALAIGFVMVQDDVQGGVVLALSRENFERKFVRG